MGKDVDTVLGDIDVNVFMIQHEKKQYVLQRGEPTSHRAQCHTGNVLAMAGQLLWEVDRKTSRI